MEEQAEREGGFDREVRVLSLRAPRARSVRCPGGDGRRRQPDGDVASTDQRAIIRGPVLNVVLRLVRRMDSRLHPSSLVCPFETSQRIRAPTPRTQGTRAVDYASSQALGGDSFGRDAILNPVFERGKQLAL